MTPKPVWYKSKNLPTRNSDLVKNLQIDKTKDLLP